MGGLFWGIMLVFVEGIFDGKAWEKYEKHCSIFNG